MQETESKKRGTIIVSNDALIQLSKAVPKELSGEALNPVQYMDILPLLAKSGFTVVIPEIVSYKAAEVLKDGTDMGRLFRPDPAQEAIRSFLKAVARNEIPGISIEDSGGPPRVTDHINGIRSANDSASSMNSEGRGRKRERERVARNIIIARHSSIAGFDDDAIVHMAQNAYAPDRHPAPVFVLTDTRTLIDRLEGLEKNIHPLTTRRMIYGVVEAGLHRKLGIDSSVAAEQLDNALWRAAHPGQTPTPMRDKEAFMTVVRRHPFTRALVASAQEMKAEPSPQPPQAAGADGGGSSAIQRFREREAKRQAMLAARHPG